jgi:hypothetical protein
MTKQVEIRFEENPFMNELVVTTKTKQVRVTNGMGKEDNVVISPSTGEIQATNVVTYKQVDAEVFVKKFLVGMTATFDLNKAGNKALHVLYWVMQKTAINKDLVQLNKYVYEDFQAEYDFKAFSMPVFNRGLKEIEAAKIIAKSKQRGFYYINPAIAWNGDRYSFTQAWELEKSDNAKDVTPPYKIGGADEKAEEQLSLGGVE